MTFQNLLQIDLFVFLFLLQLPIGSLALLMLFHLTGGRWGETIRPTLEHVTRLFPYLGLLLIPVLLFASRLYPWVAGPPEGFKAVYLNFPFFLIRTLLYFAFWIRISALLRSEHGSKSRISAAGLILHGIIVTFAAVDWAMSLEPNWYSNAFGLIYFVSSGLTALAWAVLRTPLTGRHETSDLLATSLGRDLGNLMLALTLLWAYLSFAQYLIIWLGQLPEEVAWYDHRTTGIWRTIVNILAYAGFVAPFILLLFRGIKDSPRLLRTVAALILAMHGLEQLWIILPAAMAPFV